MVEGRISAGVVVGDGSDVGGGASIMGTLSGGGKQVISIGERCLLGANAGIGISLGDDCVVEAGCYVTAGTKVTVADPTRPQPDPVIKARRALGRQQRALPPQLGHRRRSRRCRGRAPASSSTPRCTPTDDRRCGASAPPHTVSMKLRTGVALVGLAGVGVAAAVGYGLLRQVAPIFRPDECTATVDGPHGHARPRAGRERRADHRRRDRPRDARPSGDDRPRDGVPGVEALQPRVRRPRLPRASSSSGPRRAGGPARRSWTPTTPPTRSTTRSRSSTATRRCGSPSRRRRCSAPASRRRTPTTRRTPACSPRR